MADEQIQEGSQDNVPEKKKGFLKILLIALIAACLAGGTGYFFYGKTLIANYSHTRKEAKEEKKKEIGPVLSLEPFIINVSGNASRFVKISAAIELGNRKAVEHMKKMAPVIRDRITVLGAKPPEVFMDVNGRTAVKKELSDGVTALFRGNHFRAVYITDIIMQ